MARPMTVWVGTKSVLCKEWIVGDVNNSGRVCNRCVIHHTGQATVVFLLTSPISILCITINVFPKDLTC